jgi:hypothetical protein
MNSISSGLKKVAVVLLPILSVYLTHYVSTNLYAHVCANLSIIGFVTSFMTTGSPVCNSLLTIINTTHNSYAVLITGLVAGLLGLITFR